MDTTHSEVTFQREIVAEEHYSDYAFGRDIVDDSGWTTKDDVWQRTVFLDPNDEDRDTIGVYYQVIFEPSTSRVLTHGQV